MFQIDLLAFGSTPVVGSSRSNTFGDPIKATPRLNFLLFPPLQICNYITAKRLRISWLLATNQYFRTYFKQSFWNICDWNTHGKDSCKNSCLPVCLCWKFSLSSNADCFTYGTYVSGYIFLGYCANSSEHS